MSEPASKPPSVLAMVRNRILAGLFIVIPVAVSLWIASLVYSKLTEWAVWLIDHVPWINQYSGSFWFDQSVRLVSLIFMLAALFFIGQLAKMALGKKIISLAQELLLKVPLINSIYSTTKQIGDALWSSKGGMFRQVVLFQFPMKGIYSVGFMTNENKEPFELKAKLGGKELVSVFMPTTPNPTSGFLMFVPREDCIFLNMQVSEAMRLIVSGGAVIPHPPPKTEILDKRPTPLPKTEVMDKGMLDRR